MSADRKLAHVNSVSLTDWEVEQYAAVLKEAWVIARDAGASVTVLNALRRRILELYGKAA